MRYPFKLQNTFDTLKSYKTGKESKKTGSIDEAVKYLNSKFPKESLSLNVLGVPVDYLSYSYFSSKRIKVRNYLRILDTSGKIKMLLS